MQDLYHGFIWHFQCLWRQLARLVPLWCLWPLGTDPSLLLDCVYALISLTLFSEKSSFPFLWLDNAMINGFCCIAGPQLLQLLLKASQDKRFVCEEADKALNTMVGSMTPLPLLDKLRAYVNRANPRIRAKAAVSISKCVSKLVIFH